MQRQFILYGGTKYALEGNYFRAVNGKRKRLHVVVWEESNGSVPKGFVIHNRDGKTQNNNITNLELLSRSAHTIRHKDEIKKKIRVKCAICKTTVVRWGTGNNKYCGEKCRMVARKNRVSVLKNCCICGKSFKTTIYKKGKTCSRQCRSKKMWRTRSRDHNPRLRDNGGRFARIL